MNPSIRTCRTIGFPLLLLFFSIAYTATGISLGPLTVNGKLSPSFFPITIGCLAVALSLILTWRSLKNTGQAAEQIPDSENPTGVERYRVVLIIAATATFIMLFQNIAYLLSAPAYVLSIIVLFSDRSRMVQKILISVMTATLAYLMFTQGFNVRLPELWG